MQHNGLLNELGGEAVTAWHRVHIFWMMNSSGANKQRYTNIKMSFRVCLEGNKSPFGRCAQRGLIEIHLIEQNNKGLYFKLLQDNKLRYFQTQTF
jgi:hypothetical protein